MKPYSSPSRIPLKFAVAVSVLLFLFLVCLEYLQLPIQKPANVAVKKPVTQSITRAPIVQEVKPIDKILPEQLSVRNNHESKITSLNHLPIVETDYNPEKIGTSDYRAKEVFTLDTRHENTIKGRDGVAITFPENCFNTNKPVRVEVQEFVKPADIVLSGLSTTSDNALLETGGMVNLNAFDETGDSLKLAGGKSVTLTIPDNSGQRDYRQFQVFNGVKVGGKINWIPDTLEEGKKVLVKVLRAYTTNKPLQAFVYTGKKSTDFLSSFLRRKMKLSECFIDELCGKYLAVMFSINKRGEAENFRYVKNVKDSRYGRDGDDNEVSAELEDTIASFIKGLKLFYRPQAKMEYQVVLNGSQYYKAIGPRINWVSFASGRTSNGQNTFVLSSKKIGWLNCDKFVNPNKPITNLIVKMRSLPNTNVMLFLPKYKSFLTLYPAEGGKYYYSTNLFTGLNGIVIVIEKRANDYRVAVKKVNTDNRIVDDIEMSFVKEEELKAILSKICNDKIGIAKSS